MPLIDTHTHLGDPVFDADREAVLRRAAAAGVCSVVVVTESHDEIARNLALSERHPEFRLAFGQYPTRLDRTEARQFVESIRAHRERLVAIGEVGLDRWKVQEEDQRTTQRELFSQFIDLGLELDLPLNVHSRSAGSHAIELLLQRGARRVQMHAFDGKHSKAKAAVEAGYFFSVSPSIVRSNQQRKLVNLLPMGCLLLETDSPVLGPLREERNEPANVAVSLGVIAELKGVCVEEVRERVFDNTVRLYGEAILG